MRGTANILVAIGVALIAGCAGGARDVDYSRDRAISADIDASLSTTSPLLKHGQIEHDEPYGAIPWLPDTRHQPAQ